MMNNCEEFIIRWSDIDSNGHVANSSYLKLITDTRIKLLGDFGFGREFFAKNGLIPVILNEQIFYIKEIFYGQKITITLALEGYTEDMRFFKWRQSIYNSSTKQECVRGVTMTTTLDYKQRAIVAIPKEALTNMDIVPKTDNFSILSKDDIHSQKISGTEL